jgi:hypothetical protein
MAKLDDANTTGFYSEQITLSAPPFEKGKCYTIYISAAVSSVTGTMSHTFQMEAEVDANVVSDKTGYTAATVSDKTGYSLAADQSAVTIGTVTTNTDMVSDPVTLTGTASAGSVTSITLTGGVATVGYYDGQLVVIIGGTGAGQARTILSYAADTVATVTRDWAVAPSSDSVFIVVGSDWPAILEAGTASAGSASAITLESTASSISDTYKNNFIMITAGTGLGQCRLISAYNGTTKVASILPNWTTNPAAGSVYQVLPAARVDVGGWAGALATLSAGNLPDVNVAEISDDSAAANNLELDYDGTGYNKSTSTIGTCTANTDLVTAQEVWEHTVDGKQARQWLAHLVAACTGKTTDNKTKFRDPTDTYDRIVITFGGVNNDRATITYVDTGI